MESKILLESGTNELELLVFEVGGNKYGINVAKVREIRPSEPVTIIPNSHPHIEGIFMPRDVIITAVDLAKVLNLPASANPKMDMFIVTNFNKLNVSFRVHKVIGIERILSASVSDIIFLSARATGRYFVNPDKAPECQSLAIMMLGWLFSDNKLFNSS